MRRLDQAGLRVAAAQRRGSLYPALYRLEEAGEVKAVWEEGPHGRRGARAAASTD